MANGLTSLSNSQMDQSKSKVVFTSATQPDHVSERADSHYLTAKYPKHKMGLIRLRIQIEDWIEEQLNDILDPASYDDTSAILDLDEIIGIKNEQDRSAYIYEKLGETNGSKDIVDTFVSELLKKTHTLCD